MERHRSIKEWDSSERPREKFLEKGEIGVTNTELLAIIIGSGTRQKNALEISKELLENVNYSLRRLWQNHYDDYLKIEGIGKTKAVVLSAIGELVKRSQSEPNLKSESIFSASHAVDIMKPHLADLNHEECWALYLNRGNRVISKERITSGGVNSTIMDFKLIVKSALSKLSSGIIIFHNHPSGVATPSENDIAQTKKVKLALKNCDIELLDHIIIAGDDYYSFANEGRV